jgi:hypothetical protein
MVTKTRHFYTGLFAGLDQGHGPVYFDFVPVDDDFA